MPYLKTPVAAEVLGITLPRMYQLIRFKTIPRPQMDSSGDYVWTEQDIAAAREILERKRQQKLRRQEEAVA